MNQFRSWQEYFTFSSLVRTKRRYIQAPQAKQFLETLYNTSSSRQMILNKGERLWRARVGSDPAILLKKWEDEPDNEVDVALSSEKMKPMPGKAVEGRINPKGIPCLYLATCQKIAVSEVRPWIGALVTIGDFEIIREQKLIVFSDRVDNSLIYLSEPPGPEREQRVWSYVSTAFTKPVDRNDDMAEYIPTQVIAEFFKEKGFDGVAYRSAFGEKEMNVALFDIEAARLIHRRLVKIKNIDVNFEEYPSL